MLAKTMTKDEIAEFDERVWQALDPSIPHRLAELMLALSLKKQTYDRIIDRSLQRLKRKKLAKFLPGRDGGWLQLPKL